MAAPLAPEDCEAAIPGRDRLRRALAERAAHRTDLRSRRAERLARIRTATPEGDALTLLAPREPASAKPASTKAAFAEPASTEPASVETDPVEPAPAGPDLTEAASAEAPPLPDAPALTRGALRDAEALERLLAALAGTFEPASPPVAPPAAVVPLPRREPPAGGEGLASLPGAGPGLVAALLRAGVPDLAAVADLGPDGLAARLGPLARLIDLSAWTAHAREAAR